MFCVAAFAIFGLVSSYPARPKQLPSVVGPEGTTEKRHNKHHWGVNIGTGINPGLGGLNFGVGANLGGGGHHGAAGGNFGTGLNVGLNFWGAITED